MNGDTDEKYSYSDLDLKLNPNSLDKCENDNNNIIKGNDNCKDEIGKCTSKLNSNSKENSIKKANDENKNLNLNKLNINGSVSNDKNIHITSNENKHVNGIKEDYRSDSKSWKIPHTSKYEKVTQIGQGTYGKVYKGREKNTNNYVALKCILTDGLGFPITSLREISFLKNLDHPNVVKLREIVSSKDSGNSKDIGNIYLVFDFIPFDLYGILKKKYKLSPPTIKSLFHQILEGVSYLHMKGVMHRDIKSANVLVTNNGVVKIADFGLARNFNKHISSYTGGMVTLCYRAPEILIGGSVCKYNYISDLFSVGCMFVEIIIGDLLFRGKDEKEQISSIFKIMGSPIIDNTLLELNGEKYSQNSVWKDCVTYENFDKLVDRSYNYPCVLKEVLKEYK